jgi:RHS repeat-associated protein
MTPVGNLTSVNAGQPTSPCGGLTGGVALSNAYQGDPGISCGAKPGELCSSTDGNGHATTYSYDGNGNLTKVTPPAPIGATTVVPDPLSRPSSVTDPKGQKTSYTYDKNGRITQLLFNGTTTCSTSAGTCIKYTYDGAGNLKTRIDVSGTSTFTYDFENRVTAKNTPAGNSSVTYDAAGNVTKYTDASGSVSYAYDANNNVVDVVEPGGTKTGCGTLGTLCTLFGYDNGNRPKSVKYPNGVIVTIGYNTPGQETSVTATRGSTVLVSQSYTYVNGTNNVGLRQTVVDQAGNNTAYTYDLLNRLKTAVTTGPAASSYSYGYDNAGNRTSVTANGVNTTYTYNAADEITNTGFTYDSNGNLTAKPSQTYAYNSLNQTTSITTAGTPIAMAYADIGQSERTTAGSNSFLTGLLGLTRQSGGSTLAFTRTPGGSLVSMRSGSNHFYYIFDALGSVIALTDGSGAIAASYTYDPYGTTLTSSGAQASVNPFRFASGYFDSATGLTKFGDRYYDSSLGRWTQRDSIAGSIANPNAMDRYVYAGDSPVNVTDLSGRGPSSDLQNNCMLDIAGVVGGFAAIAPLVLVIGAGAVPVAPSVLGFAIGGILAVAASAGLFISDCTPLGQFMP